MKGETGYVHRLFILLSEPDGVGRYRIEQSYECDLLPLSLKLTRHLESNEASHGPTAKHVRPALLHLADRMDVISRHHFDPRVRLLCTHQPARLQRIKGLCRTRSEERR